MAASAMASFRRDVAPFWRAWVLVLTPLLLLPLPLVYNSQQTWCGYTILVMSAYWMTEALPLAATALLPTVMFPLFGVLDTTTVSQQYMTSTNLLFLSGLMVAVAVEKSNLHTRAALKVMLIVGSGVKWLMLGIMSMTMFFSMWMSNTAVAAMVTPIVEAVVVSLTNNEEDLPKNAEDDDDNDTHPQNVPDEESNEAFSSTVQLSVEEKEETPEDQQPLTAERLRPPLFLCVAYAANCGGMGTITGTPPNIVLQGILEQYYGPDTGFTFATYMLFGVPTMLLCSVLGWLLLIVMFLGPRRLLSDKTHPARLAAVRRGLERRYRALGPMLFHEWAVLVLLCVLVLLWFFRDPGFMSGWSELFTQTSIADGTAGMLIVALMFMIPARPQFWCLVPPGQNPQSSAGLLAWGDVQRSVPWGIILLMGGGLAVAQAATESGLSEWLAEKLTVLEPLPPALVAFTVCVFATLVTEVSSNTAVATILLPVMAQLSQSLQGEPAVPAAARHHQLLLRLHAARGHAAQRHRLQRRRRQVRGHAEGWGGDEHTVRRM